MASVRPTAGAERPGASRFVRKPSPSKMRVAEMARASSGAGHGAEGGRALTWDRRVRILPIIARAD